MALTILGLDISSETIGYGVLEIDNMFNTIKFITTGYFKPPKEGDLIERLVITRREISNIINKYKPDHIGIEQLIPFMKGKSSANTIITLTTFNRMICLLSYDYLNKSPELFNVLSIRHGLKLSKILPKKEDMPELVAKHLGITFPYERSKKNKIIEESYDAADGCSVALFYAFILTGKVKKPKITTNIKKKGSTKSNESTGSKKHTRSIK